MSTRRIKSDFTVYSGPDRVREVYTHGLLRHAKHLSRAEKAEAVARVTAGESVADVAESMGATETGIAALVAGKKERSKPMVYRAPILRQLPEDNATAVRVRCDRFDCELTVYACVAQYEQRERCRGCKQGEARAAFGLEVSGVVARVPENVNGERVKEVG